MKQYKNILKSRADAAAKIREILPMQRLRDESWKLIAVSKGGLELASLIRANYPNKMDILFSEPIFAPNNDECEIARVTEDQEIVINEKLVSAFEIQYDYVYGEAHRKHEEKIIASIYKYRKGRHFSSMENEVVLLIDEGTETGSKFLSALKSILAQKPKAVYIAVPVIPTDAIELLEPFTDTIYYLHAIDDYVETSLYYEEFEKVSEEKVAKLLQEK